MKNFDVYPIDDLAINTIRTLSMDAVEAAKSGHPGTPMALAPLVYVLYTRIMKHNPRNPQWIDRDRFILSAGHASMLLYSILHLTGYDVSLDDLKHFRQWQSITPGHPEWSLTPGVETTTGPLGQGLMNAVGMAMAEAHLSAVYNRDQTLIDHHTFVLCSDGDLMEGASHEAASLAGHFGLGKLVAFYDDNHITIEGETGLTYSDDVAKRFEGYNWHVQDLGDNANNINAIEDATRMAIRETSRPSLLIIRSHIGYGAPTLQDTSTVHGAPLGEEEIRATKKVYGLPEDQSFFVPDRITRIREECQRRGETLESTWKSLYDEYKTAHPDLARQFEDALHGKLPKQWDKDIPTFSGEEKPEATRNSGGKILNTFAHCFPGLIGGSGDLSPSTKTLMSHTGYFSRDRYDHKNIPWGVRELGMCGATNGLALHGGLRPFASTFFVFSDYARPAMRLAAIMKLPVIYIMTHDSIGVGEDGPTHQPVEHLAAFRAMPGMCVLRPADANETAHAWRAAIKHKTGPTLIVLTRQKCPVLDQNRLGSAKGTQKGAYILSKEDKKPDVILMGSGSEVHLLLEAKSRLQDDSIDVRVVSMPSWELFREQSRSYQNSVLPTEITNRVAVEAHVSTGWCEWVGTNGVVIALDRFGASAPFDALFENFGFTADNIANKARELVQSTSS